MIYKRYLYWSKDGITWSKWFEFRNINSEQEAKELIKSLPKKTLKLQNEYLYK